ncbi:COG4223 family protein [Asticcacaulis solisilvae]|uniref:COG4223 family protein n=1 Tax=Asticcacaulis solisilvae TaxID=1217274 RepID=UPI003FD7ACC3
MNDGLNTASDFDPQGANTAEDAAARQDLARSMRRFVLIVMPTIAIVAIGLALLAWNLVKHFQPTAATPAAATAPAVDKDAQIAQLQGQILRLQGQLTVPGQIPGQIPGQAPAPATAAPAPVYSADAAAIAQLSARLDRLETNQRALARAAATAYAATVLEEKAHTSEPFLAELAAVEPAFDDPSLTAPLRAAAEHGVPSEVELALDFPQSAMKANIASKADTDKDSLFNRARHALGSFISVRRIDKQGCKGIQGALQCAEVQLKNGNLDAALADLDTLTPSAKAALKPWLADAQARARVDALTRRLTQAALQRLVQANDGTQATAAPSGAQP